MPLGKGVSRWLNGLCAAVALSAIGGVGLLSYRTQQADRSIEPPRATGQLRDLLRMARRNVREGDRRGAKDCFDQAVRLNPLNANTRYEYAKFLLDGGSRKEAWAQLDAYLPAALNAHRSVAGDAWALAWYGDLAATFGDAKLGEKACRSVIGKTWDGAAKNAQGARLRALAHCAAGGGLLFGLPSPGRIAHNKRAIELDPKFAVAHLGLAHALIEAKRPFKAKETLDTALRLIKPGEHVLNVVAAHLLFEVGDKPRSLALLRRAAREAPASDTRLASMIGFDLMRVDEKDKALAVVNRALPFADSRRTVAYVEMAQLLAQLGKPADARAMIRQAERTAPPTDRAAISEALGRIADIESHNESGKA